MSDAGRAAETGGCESGRPATNRKPIVALSQPQSVPEPATAPAPVDTDAHRRLSAHDLRDVTSRRGLIELLRRKNVDPIRALRTLRYEAELQSLQAELVKWQRAVVESDRRVAILFEGRAAAGKGGTIRRFTEHLNPRSMRVVALPKPTEIEQGQWYFQR